MGEPPFCCNRLTSLMTKLITLATACKHCLIQWRNSSQSGSFKGLRSCTPTVDNTTLVFPCTECVLRIAKAPLACFDVTLLLNTSSGRNLIVLCYFRELLQPICLPCWPVYCELILQMPPCVTFSTASRAVHAVASVGPPVGSSKCSSTAVHCKGSH